MKSFGILAALLFSPLVAADSPAILSERNDLLESITLHTARSWIPLFQPRGLQARQACMATCSNGGCCNTGGPCTTDGYCCPSGGIACSDGGCCRAGETCTTTNGLQTCQATKGCVAPVVSCGTSCCDAGMKCVSITGGQYRCEGTNPSSSSTSTSTVAPPKLGDGAPMSKNASSTASSSGSSSHAISTTASVSSTKAAAQSSSSATVKLTTSASASSASGQVLSVAGLQMVINILAGVGGVLAALLLVH
jgi:hypothetical protein